MTHLTRAATRTRATLLLTALAVASLSLTACSAAAPSETPAPAAASSEGTWPRTVEIPAGRSHDATSITIEAAPQKIVALDYESAETLAALGLADRVVLVPEAVLNPALGSHVDELKAVPNTFPVAGEIDAETVIALAPDLAVMSPRHGNEAPIADVLAQAGIPSLQLPQPWTSPEALAVNVELIGEATGSEDAATKLTDEVESGLASAAAPGAATNGTPAADAPRVLVLTNQAGRPFITAGAAYPLSLLSLAGAQNAGDALGIDRTGPITAEQVVQANPDGIVLIDMNGSGDRMFADLLANPAVAGLPAVAKDHVLRIEGKQVQALGLTHTVDGLKTLTDWTATLR